MKVGLVLLGMAVGLTGTFCAPHVVAQDKKAISKPVLSKPHTAVLGEMIASTVSGVLATAKASDSPLTVAYDRGSEKVVIVMMGTHGSVDGAKAACETFRKNAMPLVEGVISAQYGVDLDEQSQVVLVYQNRSKANAEVIRRENGQYLVK